MGGIVRASERALYQDLWGSVSTYGDRSPGEQLAPIFHDLASTLARPPRYAWANRPHTVLDVGCGSGKGALALRGFGYDVTLADLTRDGLVAEAKQLPFVEVCLWEPLPTADFVFCCDVMEHIPTPFTMLAITRMLAAARVGVFLSIGLMPDMFGVWVGRPLHQTVQPFTTWRDQLGELADVMDARDLMHTGTFFLRGTR